MVPDILYLVASVCFILAIKGLSSAESATLGNLFGITGMLAACMAAYVSVDFANLELSLAALCVGAGIGIAIAKMISMTSLPEMVAGFHSLVGLAATLVAYAAYFAPDLFKISEGSGINKFSLIEMSLGAAIGIITFTGSIVAFLKLRGSYRGHNIPVEFNAFMISSIVCLIIYFVISQNSNVFFGMTAMALIFGATLIMPIGGADMPVIVSMLNSFSGWAASGIGFTLHNDALIITGALVGSSGAILSYIMCKGMNRSLINVIFSQTAVTNNTAVTENNKAPQKSYKQGVAEDAAFILQNANSVIIVPGYGMATSQCQYALKEMGDLLKKNGATVRYAIHPVAGRMPGHMNVLLAEANVPYDDVLELDEINSDFKNCDVAYVVGANDVTNPAAKNDPTSSIYGMPILDVEKAKVVLFLKRTMGAGYAGVDNELFYAQNTMMLLGDAKKTTEAIVKELSKK